MDAKEIKEYRKKHNLTQNDLAQITKCSLRTVQYWERGEHKIPKSALEWIKIFNHSHNGTTHNTNTQGDNNIYINNSQNALTDKETQSIPVQANENNIYTEMIATQRELIANQNELISQYRKEIEYLRQKVKEYREKYEK